MNRVTLTVETVGGSFTISQDDSSTTHHPPYVPTGLLLVRCLNALGMITPPDALFDAIVKSAVETYERISAG